MVDPRELGLEVHGMTGDEFRCLCPYHDDSHPSATFSPVKGLLYCFTCGKSWTAKQIAEDLGGTVVNRDSLEEAEALASIGVTNEWRRFLDLPVGSNDYLASRKVDEKTARMFDIRAGKSLVVFPHKDMTGEVVGAQTRSTVRKAYRFWGKKCPYWPAEAMMNIEPNRPVYLVEGAFGAIRGLQAGVQAIAINGAASVSKSLPFFSPIPTVIAIFDDDRAGHIASAKALAHGLYFCAVRGVEPDELSIDQWHKLVSTNPKYFSKSIERLLSGVPKSERLDIIHAYRKELRHGKGKDKKAKARL